MNNASLVVVGCGIKFISHLTTEAKVYIQQADKVLYLLNDPAMKEWVQKSNPHAESLDYLYNLYPMRHDCYHAISEYILETVRKNQHVCVVLYGHPTVFSQPALDAVRQARQEGYFAKILPGISAEDCLFADLLVDPGSCGCQSYEATDFLVYRRQFSPFSHLILWQVGIIGVLGQPDAFDNVQGASFLVDYLNKAYNLSHPVFLYEAAQYPHFDPRIEEMPLHQLPQARFTAISTLYIPPCDKSIRDEKMLNALGVNLTDATPKHTLNG